MVKIVFKGFEYILDVLEHLAVKTAVLTSYGLQQEVTCSSPCGVLQYEIKAHEQDLDSLSNTFKQKSKFYLSLLNDTGYSESTINKIYKDKEYFEELSSLETNCVKVKMNRNIKNIKVS